MDLGDALTSFTRGDVEPQLFGSLATSSSHLTSTTEQRVHSKQLDVELHCSLENDSPRENSRVENDLYRNRVRAQNIRADLIVLSSR